MKALVCTVSASLLCLCCFWGMAQNIEKAEYFIDSDPGYGAATNINISPNSTLSDVSYTIPAGTVSNGFHVLYIRVRNSQGVWSQTYNRPFYKDILPVQASNIVKAEYFIDTDPGYGSATNIAITPGAVLSDISYTAALGKVSNGFHIFYIRVLDADGKWSQTYNKPFYQDNVPNSANIVKAEYFIDSDPGFGVASNVPISPSPTITNNTFTADLTQISSGNHSLYFRIKDSQGKWSMASVVNFTKGKTAGIVTVSFPNNTLQYNVGESATIRATIVIDSSFSGTTSKVEFYDGTTLLSSDNTNPYSYTLTNLTSGVHRITAKSFFSDSSSTTSDTVAINVVPITSTTGTITVSLSNNKLTYTLGEAVTINAATTVVGGTINKVEFFDGTTLLGSDLTLPYSLTVANLTTGIHPITAKSFFSDSSSTTSDTVAINVVPITSTTGTITVSLPNNNLTYTLGEAVTINAATTVVGGTINKVEFYDGTTLLGSDLTLPYSLTVANLTTGIHPISAKSFFSDSSSVTSAIVAINVVPITSTTGTITLSLPNNKLTYNLGEAVTINAATTVVRGTINKVEFYDGTILLGSDLTLPYSLTVANLTSGVHDISSKSIYADSNSTTSTSVFITINGTCTLVNIPDANFKSTLIQKGIDLNSNGEIDYCEAEDVSTLNVSRRQIKDLTGIEAFTSLTELNCDTNLLVTLNLRTNATLNSLSCKSNLLSTLDVSGAPLLTYLNCSFNQLSNLDVRKNLLLKRDSSGLRTESNPNLKRICIASQQIGDTSVWRKDAQAAWSVNCDPPLPPVIEVTDSKPDIKIYNFISPNGDGKHDYFEIENIEFYEDNKLQIFSRWGQKLYSVTGFKNTDDVFEGNDWPDGTYYYVLDLNNDKKVERGFFLLKR